MLRQFKGSQMLLQRVQRQVGTTPLMLFGMCQKVCRTGPYVLEGRISRERLQCA